MTIEDYIKKMEPEVIAGIPFLLTDVNYEREADINEKFPYDSDTIYYYSFLERLEKAREEIAEDIERNNFTDIEEVYNYYKRLTEEGNHSYWGSFMSIWTHEWPRQYLLYDVRMD